MSCNTGCLVATEFPDVFEQDCKVLIKDCGVSWWALSICDHTYDDLSQGEIDAAKTAKKLIKMPASNVTITGEDGALVKVGCRELPTPGTYTLNIVSPSMSDDGDIAMFEYYSKIDDLRDVVSVLWQECNDFVFLNPEWVAWNNAGAAGQAPTAPLGIEIKSMSTPKRIRNEGEERCEWLIEIKFKYTGVVMPTVLPGIEF